jgi:hypothetical protein
MTTESALEPKSGRSELGRRPQDSRTAAPGAGHSQGRLGSSAATGGFPHEHIGAQIQLHQLARLTLTTPVPLRSNASQKMIQSGILATELE